jgi:hypothetical protein
LLAVHLIHRIDKKRFLTSPILNLISAISVKEDLVVEIDVAVVGDQHEVGEFVTVTVGISTDGQLNLIIH